MKYDHHPDPAIGFEIEVQEIEAIAHNRRVGFGDTKDLEPRIDRAMMFNVGGDAGAVRAKERLREIERTALGVPLRAGEEE